MAKKRIRFSSRKNIKKVIKKKETLEICFPDNEMIEEECTPDTLFIVPEEETVLAFSEKREVLPPQENVSSTIQEQTDSACLDCVQDIESSSLKKIESAPTNQNRQSSDRDNAIETCICDVLPSVGGEPSRALDLVKPNDLAPAEREVSLTEKEKKTVSVIMLAPGTFAVPSKQFEEVKVIRIVEMDDRWANFSILIDVEQLDFQFTNIINLQTNMPLSLICPIEHQQDLPFFNENILKSPFLLNSPKSKNKYIMRKPITSDMFIAWSDKRDPYKTYKISMIMKNNRINSTMDNMMNYACIQLFNTMVFDFNISPFFFCTK